MIPTLVPQHSSAKSERPERDISIVIPHRGPEIGLWLTVNSCHIELETSGLTYEFIIVHNGEKSDIKTGHDLKRIKDYLGKTGCLADFIHVEEPLSPPSARQLGAEAANGDYLFFFDNHCMVTHGFFNRAIETMKNTGADLLHCVTRLFQGGDDFFEYRLSLSKDFWSAGPYPDPQYSHPYRIAIGGHGAFAIKRRTFEEVGGYWQGFVGYGGEESYLDLKLWLLGKTVWIDPGLLHYHWGGARTYDRHFTDDFFRNMMMCANIIGGQEWMDKVYKSFEQFTRFVKPGETPTPMFDLYADAMNKSAQYASQFAERRKQSLNSLLLWFDQQGIRH